MAEHWHSSPVPLFFTKINYDDAVIGEEYQLVDIVGSGSTTKYLYKPIILKGKTHHRVLGFLWKADDVICEGIEDHVINTYTLRSTGSHLLMR